MLAVTQGDDKFIYVADPDSGQVLVYSAKATDKPIAVIPIGAHGNQPGRGHPDNMIELHRGDKTHLVFVTDTAADKIHIIDVKFNTVSNWDLTVGPAPRALAITPDQEKLSVSTSNRLRTAQSASSTSAATARRIST